MNNKPKDSDEKCCRELGVKPHDVWAALCCFICNLIRARKLFNTASFCKKLGWDKTCKTCRKRNN